MALGCKDIEIRESEFMTKTKFLFHRFLLESLQPLNQSSDGLTAGINLFEGYSIDPRFKSF